MGVQSYPEMGQLEVLYKAPKIETPHLFWFLCWYHLNLLTLQNSLYKLMCVGHFAFHIWPPWLICKNIIFFYHNKLFPSMVIIIQYCKWRLHHEKVCMLTNTSCISSKSVTRLAEWLISSEYNECSSVCMPSRLWNRFLPWHDNQKQIKLFSLTCLLTSKAIFTFLLNASYDASQEN